jgi:hypothetical protein
VTIASKGVPNHMMHNVKSAALLAALFFFAACGVGTGGAGAAGCVLGFGREAGPPRVELVTDAQASTIHVAGLTSEQRASLRDTTSREAWQAVFTVAVAPDQPPMLGDYAFDGDRVVFTPMFPFDPGRQYFVSFTPPGATAITATVGLPATHTTPTTVVAQVYPSGDVIPENQLRLYIHFSAPMGMKGGLEYVHLLDDRGQAVKDPFLPLDAEFWNGDRTRYTVFFDPGRQKRGIPVIEEMGRSLTEGKSYTLVVDAEWRDGNGLPLKEQFRRTFRVAAPDERPLDPSAWQIEAPAAGTRTPVTVAFPEPLDHGLLLRALGVQGADGQPLGGEIVVGRDEMTWTFTPKELWKAGAHHLVAFAMLEDLAGNRIGRAFEVDQFDRSDKSAEPDKTLVPFTVR